MDSIYVYLADLPGKVSEMVTPCADGYTVYINARMSTERQRKAYNHALKHIRNNDWERTDVQLIEEAAHN